MNFCPQCHARYEAPASAPARKCRSCGAVLADGVNFCPRCHAKCSAAAEKTPVEWVNEYFADAVAVLRGKVRKYWNPVFVATDVPCECGLTPEVFAKMLDKLGLGGFTKKDDHGYRIEYDRCIMIFDNDGNTVGRNTCGGVITPDGIVWSFKKGFPEEVKCGKFVRWEDIGSIVQKHSLWKREYIEVDGEYIVIEAMGDDCLGRENFREFLSAISGKQVICEE